MISDRRSALIISSERRQQTEQADYLFLSIDQRDGDQGGAVGAILQGRGETLLLGSRPAHLEDHRRSRRSSACTSCG